MPLQADGLDFIGRRNKALAAFELRRQVFHLQVGKEIVLIGAVAHGPEQAGGNRLRSRLRTKFGLPFFSVLIADVEFGTCAMAIFFDELYGEMRLMFLASGAVKQVQALDVS